LLYRHPFTLRDHGHGASASHGVPVYVPAFAAWYSLRLPTEWWPSGSDDTAFFGLKMLLVGPCFRYVCTITSRW